MDASVRVAYSVSSISETATPTTLGVLPNVTRYWQTTALPLASFCVSVLSNVAAP
ncbi:MAG TPA: hypothetical protein VIK13_00400 [Candidatus Limnocylindrales bacterium]